LTLIALASCKPLRYILVGTLPLLCVRCVLSCLHTSLTPPPLTTCILQRLALPVVAAEDSAQEAEHIAAALAASLGEGENLSGAPISLREIGTARANTGDEAPVRAELGLSPQDAQEDAEPAAPAPHVEAADDATLRAAARELNLAPASFSGLRTQTSIFSDFSDSRGVTAMGDVEDQPGRGGGRGAMEGFPAEDLQMCLGDKWAMRVGLCNCISIIVLIAVLVPSR